MFRRTFRTLDTETDGRSRWVPALAAVLVCAWGYWFTRVPVDLVESSLDARVEVNHASFWIDAPVAGRVVQVHDLRAGRRVRAGEVLLELDADEAKLDLDEVHARMASTRLQLAALESEVGAEEQGLEARDGAELARVDEASGRLQEALVAEQQAHAEAQRLRLLASEGVASTAELTRARAEARRARATRAAIDAVKRGASRGAAAERQKARIRIASLARARAELNGALLVDEARVAQLSHAVSQRIVRAPHDAVIASVGGVRTGSMLRVGDRIVGLVASDELRVVAQFSPAAVFGRIHAGQAARVAFSGFPWTEYGRPSATVVGVAGEAQGGSAQVELELDAATLGQIPPQHGQPAVVMVALDRATPWQLLLRVVGESATHEPAAAPELAASP